MRYDAVLIVSFGGPRGPADVVPFLENVLRGRRVPRERMLEVAEHYRHFGGVSPINEQVSSLASSLRKLLAGQGPNLPVYIGNRNWDPYLADTLRQMAADGVSGALAFITSAFGSYSGCRQYLENIEEARRIVGPAAPAVHRLRLFYNHPGFLEPMAELVRVSLDGLPAELRGEAELIFTAHSVPLSMARSSPYEEQLREACAAVAALAGHSRWKLVYQSRSGPPEQAWLEPDVNDYLRNHAPPAAVLAPVGFLSDHLEVLWDLDTEARATCLELGIPMRRAATVGAHPRFIRMIRELILERVQPGSPRLAYGAGSPWPDVCPPDCCLPPRRP